MWGGYSTQEDHSLRDILEVLRINNVVPSLSCGMQPGLVQAINSRFGVDYMANVGGAIHGHSGGTLSGVKAMRQAIDGNHGTEYDEAIEMWGLVE
jgi:ribulose 1,5-bisphosphate carboxylase large subunit-like protein